MENPFPPDAGLSKLSGKQGVRRARQITSARLPTLVSAASAEKPQEKPIVVNPQELMEGFYNSQQYRDGFTTFFAGKTLAPTVTEEDKGDHTE